MSGSNRGRLRPVLVLARAALAVSVALACASSGTPGSSNESQVISDVRVESEGEATIVTLKGLEHPIFTAFEQQDPERLVVDVTSARVEELAGPIAVYDGLVEEVALSPFASGLGEASTRVEITLAALGDYQVTPTEEGLEIRLVALPEAMEPTAAIASDDTALEDDPWAIVPEGPAAEPAPMTPATTLTRIDAREAGEGWILHLRADGSIGSASSFTLDDPARLVVDLPELVSAVPQDRVSLDSPRISAVRIGQHSDHVRVVIDGGSDEAPFESRRVMPVADGLIVALGSGEALEAAVDEAADAATLALATPSEPRADEEDAWSVGSAADDASDAPADAPESLAAAEPAEEPQAPKARAEALPGDGGTAAEAITVYGVEFDAQEQRDRIVVLGDEPAPYFVYEPDDDTVVLSIEGAEIDPEAAVRIAPETGGPVSLVTAFAQPETDTPEVRVVIKRAAGLKPEVSRRGSLLVVDFPRDGSVAATPPVLAQVPGEPLLAEASTPPAQAGATTPSDQAEDPAASASATELQADEPAAIAPSGTLPTSQGAAEPASLEPPAAISILEEGGLLDGKEYTGRRISLDFKDVEIADVLRLIAEVSDLNVIAGDEVKGRVTIRLVDVPWDQALDVILLTKGLGFVRIGNVLRIASADVLAQEEEVRLQERRAKEKLEDLVVKLQPVNYADAGSVSGMVTQLLTPRGSVNVDARTNTLIIKDIPSVIDEATALVKAIDTQTPQVMIEAKVVEASLDFSREFGSVWGFGVQPLVDPFDAGLGARDDAGGGDFRLNTTNPNTNNVAFNNPLTAGPTALWNLGAFILDEKLNLDVQLQAAEVNGDGKVISSPRVVTMDNTDATIEQGVSIPFQTFENGDAQLEFVDAVLALRVKPHITADRSIIMDIQVSRNAPDDSVFTLTGSPAIAKNQVKTETLVKDGQTLVIGGIYVIDTSERQSRVPYLHQIPVLGAAFRSDEISDSRKELLIFVTPRIVVSQLEAR